MNGKDDDRNIVDDALSLFEAGKEFYDENQEIIDGMVGAAARTDLDTPEPLSEIHKTGEHVELVAEMRGEDIDSIGVNIEGNTLEVKAGDKVFVGEVPDDINTEDIDATLVNGTLSVRIEREGGDD